MNYKVIQENAQMSECGFEKDGAIYLPLNDIWDDYSILEKRKKSFFFKIVL